MLEETCQAPLIHVADFVAYMAMRRAESMKARRGQVPKQLEVVNSIFERATLG